MVGAPGSGQTAGGLILHYDGLSWSTWREVHKADAGSVSRLWGTSGTNVLAVASYMQGGIRHASLLRFDGVDWIETPLALDS
jgi:hypothetical protein